MTTRIVYIYLLKMQLAACFKYLSDNVGMQITNLNVHRVIKKVKNVSLLYCLREFIVMFKLYLAVENVQKPS